MIPAAQRRAIARRLIANRARAKSNSAKGVEASRAVEAHYTKNLLDLVGMVKQAIDADILPVLTARQVEYVQDESISDLLARAFDGLRNQFSTLNLLYARMANRMVVDENSHHRSEFIRSVEAAIGVNVAGMLFEEGLEATIKASVHNNVQLIKSIPAQYLDQVETLVMQGVGGGKAAPNIREELEKRFDVAESRARLIARDQLSKLAGNLSRGRQDQVGVTEYIWRTSRDERVRDSHEKKDGKKFKWSDPPSDTGHPGEDVQCRCTPEPVFDHLLG